MTDKLNDNDRQRIEQEAEKYSSNKFASDSTAKFIWKEGAEYGTIHNRNEIERMKELLTYSEDRNTIYLSKIEQLEAERSEVVSLLKEYANDTGAVDTNLKARVKMYLAEHKL